MKKYNKPFSIIAVCVIVLALLAIAFFTFIPFKSGTNDYVTLYQNIRVSATMKNGMYGEYTVIGDSTDKDINKALTEITKILADKGYPNTNVYRLGDNQIRIEIHGPSKTSDYSVFDETLKLVGGGVFQMNSTSSCEDAFINGAEHIKNVSVQTTAGKYYVVLEFNSAGETAYYNLTSAAAATEKQYIYMFLGGEAFPNSTYNYVSGIDKASTENKFYIGFENMEYANQVAFAITFGSINIEIDPDTVKVGTLDSLYGTSLPLVLAQVFTFVNLFACIIFVAIRYKFHGLTFGFSMLINLFLSIFLFQAINYIEFDISSFIALNFGILIIFASSAIIFEKINREYVKGKSREASFEIGLKTNMTIVDISVIVGLVGLIFAICGIKQIQSVGFILFVIAILNLITNVLLVKFFTIINETLFRLKEKSYNMKRGGQTK